MSKILLVEPNFPIATKSKNHAHFLPIGLLKIGTYHKQKWDRVKLVRGLKRCGFTPDRILITSIFTYWSKYVHEAAKFYHQAYPKARIEIGGIYASLMPKHCKKNSPFAYVYRGLYHRGVAEKVVPDYSLLPEKLDYQIINLEADDAISYSIMKESTHNDPFDRMLIQQSINRNMVIISKDREFKKFIPYGLKVIW